MVDLGQRPNRFGQYFHELLERLLNLLVLRGRRPDDEALAVLVPHDLHVLAEDRFEGFFDRRALHIPQGIDRQHAVVQQSLLLDLLEQLLDQLVVLRFGPHENPPGISAGRDPSPRNGRIEQRNSHRTADVLDLIDDERAVGDLRLEFLERLGNRRMVGFRGPDDHLLGIGTRRDDCRRRQAAKERT